MTSLPDLEALTRFTHQEALHDPLVRRSIEEGYMTEEELLIGRYVGEYCNVQCPRNPEEEDEVYEKRYNSHLPTAYETTAEQFQVTPQRAQELYKGSLEIRNRIIKREQTA
ncbi:MAG: hypothetical protein AABX70_01710 [Nanoarchaeota archaeon]